MNLPSVLFAVAAFGAAIVAAGYGYGASKIEAEPIGPDWGSPGTGAHIEPFTTEGKVLDLSVASMKSDQAIRDAMGKAGRLNRISVHNPDQYMAALRSIRDKQVSAQSIL